MTTEQATAAGLDNNAFSLATAVDADGHCEPASRVVCDGHHKGTIFSWFDGEWIVTDIENREYRGHFDRLAVVSLDYDSDDLPEVDDADAADYGLNQAMLGCDLDCGEWVVDAEDLDDLRETYGESLIVLWEQQR